MQCVSAKKKLEKHNNKIMGEVDEQDWDILDMDHDKDLLCALWAYIPSSKAYNRRFFFFCCCLFVFSNSAVAALFKINKDSCFHSGASWAWCGQRYRRISTNNTTAALAHLPRADAFGIEWVHHIRFFFLFFFFVRSSDGQNHKSMHPFHRCSCGLVNFCDYPPVCAWRATRAHRPIIFLCWLAYVWVDAMRLHIYISHL